MHACVSAYRYRGKREKGEKRIIYACMPWHVRQYREKEHMQKRVYTYIYMHVIVHIDRGKREKGEKEINKIYACKGAYVIGNRIGHDVNAVNDANDIPQKALLLRCMKKRNKALHCTAAFGISQEFQHIFRRFLFRATISVQIWIRVSMHYIGECMHA